MQKQIYYFFLLASLIVSPGAHSKTITPFNAFYAGGALGASFTKAHEQISGSADAVIGILGTSITTLVPIGLTSDMTKNSLTGSLFAGYGHTWQRFYLGGELQVSEADYKTSNQMTTGLSQNIADQLFLTANANIQIQEKISPVQFSAALRPGILLSPQTLLYGRVGATMARVNFNATTTADGDLSIISSPDINTPLNLFASNTKQGAFLQLGGGLEQYLDEHWTLRADYIYTNYGRIKANAVSSAPIIFNDAGTITQLGNFIAIGNNNVNLISQTLMLGATYQFDA